MDQTRHGSGRLGTPPRDRLLPGPAAHEIQFLVDVRSAPYSRFTPPFNRRRLEPVLAATGVRYLFAGDELGGRPSNAKHYDAEGHALYGEMALELRFRQMIDRLADGVRDHRIALMCSEGRPGDGATWRSARPVSSRRRPSASSAG